MRSRLCQFALFGLLFSAVGLAAAAVASADEPQVSPPVKAPSARSPAPPLPMVSGAAGPTPKAPAATPNDATHPTGNRSAASPPAASSPPTAAADSNTVAEVKPEVFYVRDKENHLVPVPGFSYEDFVKYYRLKEQLDRPDVKPRYNLEQLTLDGTAHSDRAEIIATIKVLLLDTNWSRIPLRLNNAALREPAGYQGGGDEFLQYEPSGEGYVCWLRGGERSEHKLTLKLSLPLATVAGENRLEMSLPRAAASKLSLFVPIRNVAATASAANLVPDVTQVSDGSRISLLGIGGDSWIAWRAADQPAAQISSALEATGTVLVKIDGRSVSSEAALVVRSFGAEFDHFRVRLPSGAQLTGGQQPGYSLAPVGDSGGSLVEVRLDRKTVGPIEVRLLTERAYDVTKSNESVELSGFAVVEAIPHRQWGHIAVAVAGDWQIIWGEKTRVRQTDDLPEGLRRKDLAAGFEYFGQPNSLKARVVPRKTRVSVDPQYIYRISAERTELEARLRYSIRGARLFKLDLDLPGWELDTVSPDTAVDANALAIEPGGAIVMPLLSPAVGDLDVTIKAHRDHSAGVKVVEWSLPEPQADVINPAEVTIIPTENVEISPQNDKLAGLSRSAGALPSVESSAGALFYRSQQPKARFAADFNVHTQSIKVATDAKIGIHAHQTEVTQSFQYEIRYEPLDRLILDVPRKLFDDQRLSFSIGGESLEAYEVGEQPSSERRSVRVSLKQPTMGPVRLDIAFAMPQPDLSTAVATATDIPLVVPSDGRDYSNVAIVTADRGIRVEQREGPWSIVEASKNPTAAPLSIHLTSGDPAAELRLALAIDDRRPEQATFVDRQWIQTWLTKSVRQDRAVFHITSDAESLHIKLPAGIQPRDVELAVDGTAISPEGDSAGGLLVKLGAGSPRREHLVAMRYQFDGQGARTGWQPFDLPSFEKPVKVRETYWQLVLPSDEALLGADGNLAPEYIWRWRDYGLGIERVPLKEQPQLEQWVGMTVASRGGNSAAANERPLVDDDLPSQTSRYLFSTAGPEGRFAILVIPRWMLLFGASLGALVVGLSLIYVPAVRRPHVLIAAAALLLIAVLVWPEAALLLAQAASLGVGLVLLASALRRMMTWSDSREMTSSGRAPAIAERSSQRARFRSLDDEKAATTTASIAVEVSASGSGESAVGADGADTGDEERQAAEPAVGASGSSRAHRLT